MRKTKEQPLKKSWADKPLLGIAVAFDKVARVAKKAFMVPYKAAPTLTIYMMIGTAASAAFFAGAALASVMVTGGLSLGLPAVIAGTSMKWTTIFATSMQGLSYAGEAITRSQRLLKEHKLQKTVRP